MITVMSLLSSRLDAEECWGMQGLFNSMRWRRSLRVCVCKSLQCARFACSCSRQFVMGKAGLQRGSIHNGYACGWRLGFKPLYSHRCGDYVFDLYN